jgi:phosphoglucomutase
MEPRKKIELETKKNILLLDEYISHLTNILDNESLTEQEKRIGYDLLQDIEVMNSFDILNNNISRISTVSRQLLDISDFSVMISKETILLAKEIHHFILTIKEEVN